MKKKISLLAAVVVMLGLTAAAPAYATPGDPGNPVIDHGTPAGIPLADKPNAKDKTKVDKKTPSTGVRTNATTVCGSGTPCYYYAGKKQNSITGSDGPQIAMTVEKPGILASLDFHSLAEVTAQDSGGGNIVEFGWSVDTANPDLNPRIFWFTWVGGVAQGYNTGFVPVASPVKAYNATLTQGSTVTLDVRHFTTAQCSCTAGWWLAYNSSFLGVYPDTIWTGAGQTFTGASTVQAFGEVALGYDPSQTDMGSSLLATSTVGAQMASYGLFGTAPSTPAWTASVSGISPLRWNVALTGAGQNFRYGGPGGTNEVGTQGTGDFCSGVATVGNGEACAYNATSGTGTSTVGVTRRWSIDEANKTACYSIGTGAGYGASNYLAMAGYNQVQFWQSTNCTGTTTTLSSAGASTNNVIAIPAGYAGAANLSVKVLAALKSPCATGYSGVAATC
jgi:hypothetical protein